LGSRFQWELCDNFIYQADGWKDADLDNNLSRLRAAFDNIQREADFRKQLEFRRPENRDRLVWAFKTKQDQNAVDENLAKQQTLKEDFMQGIEKKNIDQIKSCLKQLQVLNMQLVVRVAKRYEELLQEIPLEILE
jgi:hypothetical protein